MRCSRRRQCRPYADGHATLHRLIDIYVRQYRPGAEAELAFFSGATLERAVEQAALARDGEGKRFSHQRRLTSRNLAQALARLQAKLPQIGRCSDFEELIGLIEAEVRDIKGLGELYCYDTALRIGTQQGIAPEHVYLHRGTRVGARNLGLEARARYLTMADLPPAFHRLAPQEVEDFLCIFKEQLKRFDSEGFRR